MNERFRLLARQALVERASGFKEFDAELFAQLIVKECAQVCRDQPNIYAMKADRDNCAIAIEEHFGIDE